MKLYHATFKDLLPLIKKNGLGNSPYKNWNDSDNKFVYLASDPYEAESYCEATEEENDYVDSDIIIFEIDTKLLDKSKLHKDKNVIDGETTFQYEGVIPFNILKIFKELNEATVYEIDNILRISGIKLKEEYLFSTNDMKSLILKNPSQREIKETGITDWRIVVDDYDNYYFGDAYSFIHSDIVDKVNSSFEINSNFNGDGIALYKATTNTFIYRAPIFNIEDCNMFQNIAKKYFNNSYIKNNFNNYKIAVSSEEEPWIDYTETL